MGELVIRAVSVPIAPFLLRQGRQVRESMPPMEPAPGDPFGLMDPIGGAETVNVAEPLRVLIFGESTVAGCGAPSQADALGGRVAAAMAEQTQQSVSWRAVGRIGATAARSVERLEERVAELDKAVDLVIVALGANDVLRQTPATKFTRNLAAVVKMLRSHLGPVPVVMAGMPPIGVAPSLPQPLRSLIALRAWWLDRAMKRWAAQAAGVAYASTAEIGRTDATMFAEDGFHPSPPAYALWAELLAQRALEVLKFQNI